MLSERALGSGDGLGEAPSSITAAITTAGARTRT